MTGSTERSAGRWWVVAGTGVLCGAIVGWLLWALTGAWGAAIVVGAGVASILVVLAVAGARHNRAFRLTEDRAAAARVRRARVEEAMRATRRPPD